MEFNQHVDGDLATLLDNTSFFREKADAVSELGDAAEIQKLPDEGVKQRVEQAENLVRLKSEHQALGQEMQKVQAESANLEQFDGNGAHAANDDDDVIIEGVEETGGEIFSLYDPWSKALMKNPVRNSMCGHIYDRDSVMQIIKDNIGIRCPVLGCAKMSYIQPAHLVEDANVRRQVHQRMAEEAEEDDDTSEEEEDDDLMDPAGFKQSPDGSYTIPENSIIKIVKDPVGNYRVLPDDKTAKCVNLVIEYPSPNKPQLMKIDDQTLAAPEEDVIEFKGPIPRPIQGEPPKQPPKLRKSENVFDFKVIPKRRLSTFVEDVSVNVSDFKAPTFLGTIPKHPHPPEVKGIPISQFSTFVEPGNNALIPPDIKVIPNRRLSTFVDDVSVNVSDFKTPTFLGTNLSTFVEPKNNEDVSENVSDFKTPTFLGTDPKHPYQLRSLTKKNVVPEIRAIPISRLSIAERGNNALIKGIPKGRYSTIVDSRKIIFKPPQRSVLRPIQEQAAKPHSALMNIQQMLASGNVIKLSSINITPKPKPSSPPIKLPTEIDNPQQQAENKGESLLKPQIQIPIPIVNEPNVMTVEEIEEELRNPIKNDVIKWSLQSDEILRLVPGPSGSFAAVSGQVFPKR